MLAKISLNQWMRLDQLKELNTLVLSRNPINKLGESLVKVKSITKLSLSDCQLQAIDSLMSCTELKELRLAHNDIKFGCCRPPPQCGFVPRQNETSWELPKKGLASKDHDCVAWSSNRDKMCYDCESCKAGHVAARVIELHGDSGFCIGFPIFLFIIFGIAYCALRNSNQKCRGCV
ncbi:tetraspanin-3-like isoform X5 [Camellia sinensis]|uniref:tetraspanin-3-like isoform X5 n=1 Tax=Camellia sinensis TaxID=4442 RepID=UPI0010356258|nr:tetraspanin-3-like isoform X5 [Camellia sinensis]XP_028085668.1 tetraspanin-3-like isoform X5 [Camellia sinensis]XP_028085669.1 tetraspanin-3-like isoform X5 [Camellia sinensis]